MQCYKRKKNINNIMNEVTSQQQPQPPQQQNQVLLEITVAIVGSVDAGKTTMVGVLTNDTLDDGNGKARANIFNYPHERESGRTSSIGHAYVRNNDRIINFVDLCGHAAYLKTTVRGMTSNDPDFALVCIGTNVTDMTKEHIRLLLAMNIPFMFVLTKIDITPERTMNKNIAIMKKFASDCKRQFIEINSTDTVDAVIGNNNLSTLIPFIRISNVTGKGINILKSVLSTIQRKSHTFPPVFSISSIYKVPGWGLVCSGYTGVEIRKGQELYIGPFKKHNKSKNNKYEVCGFEGMYEKTYVRSVHNDYREFVDVLPAFTRGCLCIKWDPEKRTLIRSGMILSPTPQPVYKRFNAEVVVFNNNHTSIRNGFCAFANCGAIREPIRFIKVPDLLRSGDKAAVEIEFIHNSYFLTPETLIFFRESALRGVCKLIHNNNDDDNINNDN
jgi:elongation factor 1-alpha